MSDLDAPLALDPKHVAAFVAIVCRDPLFDPEYPAHEDAIAWLYAHRYARETFLGPVPTEFGIAFYRIAQLDHGWPDIP
ncbi:hypothetical protein ACI2VH_23625 [Ralstonia nicotianae]|uniref:Uncharacterized protein n=1 Tax=Ralstonia nicotianae TaxID=3037696 RepID=A0ABX7ZTU6_9RALS|nr:hypothetical protein [Ralstonia nicotianae]QUP58510.1 hypothetical protein GO999_08010 [Ralstonia nicotianae]